jgi:hypothetical protein
VEQLDLEVPQLLGQPRAKQREPVSQWRARHVEVRLGDVYIAVRPHDRDRDARLAERIALPPDRDRDTADIRERDVGKEGDMHARSLGR